jgi:hypothetical protein
MRPGGKEGPSVYWAPDEPPASKDYSSKARDGSEKSVNDIFKFTKEVFHGNVIYSLYLEALLEEKGLLSRLEEADILPRVENPNPFDVELEEQLNEQWAREHPDEMAKFEKDFEEREHILRLLYVGGLLTYIVHVPSPFHDQRQ